MSDELLETSEPGNDPGSVASENSGCGQDTPIHRATINELSVTELEKQLDVLRERRLLARQKVEKIAKINTEQADLKAYLRFEKLLKAVKKEQEKIDDAVTKQEANVHKLRALIVEMGV